MLKITASLLNSWLFYKSCDETKSQDAWIDFCATLEKKQKGNQYMRKGIDFEQYVESIRLQNELESNLTPQEQKTASDIARLVAGCTPQVRLARTCKIGKYDVQLVGVLDYLRPNIIFDVKKVANYEYGKYFNNAQTSMYFALVPSAEKMIYLISDGFRIYVETYNRSDCKDILVIIKEFFEFLKTVNKWETYKENWRK